MRRKQIVAAVVASGLFVISAAGAAQNASIERGRSLFSDPKLGTSGKTCSTCHHGGKGLAKAAMNAELESTINACIAGPLKGKALDRDSADMQSLVLYLKSLGGK